MAAQICIKMARGTFCQLFNIVNRFLQVFSNLDIPIRSIFPRVYEYPIFRQISLSKPHPKVIKIISNNSKNSVEHKKYEKHKMESEMKFNLRQRLQTGAKNVPSMKHMATIFYVVNFL